MDTDCDEIPEWAYVCDAGHVSDARATSIDAPSFDYRRFCRRYTDGYGKRCCCPVVQARKFPELYAAFLLGGEDAVRAIVLRVLDQQGDQDGKHRGTPTSEGT